MKNKYFIMNRYLDSSLRQFLDIPVLIAIGKVFRSVTYVLFVSVSTISKMEPPSVTTEKCDSKLADVSLNVWRG